MRIEDIETDLGNRILMTLLDEGWHKQSEYSPELFDKGIDYDSYTLTNGEDEIVLEWTNWFEWEIEGAEAVLSELQDRFGLADGSKGKGREARPD